MSRTINILITLDENYIDDLVDLKTNIVKMVKQKEIRINDRGAIVNFMLGLNAYTISSGIFPKYLHGDNIIAVPLDEPERMEIGYIHPEKQPLSELGAVYIQELKKYAPADS